MDIKLPYFDLIFDELERKNPRVVEAVGLNVHWGYWEDPDRADISLSSIRNASNDLTVQLFQEAALGDGQSVLDVGCGFGGTLAMLDNLHRKQRLVGLNIDARQLERAKKEVILRPEGGNTLEFVEADACKLPFEAASFDNVFAVECIFHFPSRKRFFEEAFRVLKPGGRLILSDFIAFGPSLPLLGALYLPYRGAISDIYGLGKRTPTVQEYRKLAKQTHFKVCTIRDITRNTLPTYSVLRSFSSEFGEKAARFQKCNEFFEIASRMRMLRYDVLSFEKP